MIWGGAYKSIRTLRSVDESVLVMLRQVSKKKNNEVGIPLEAMLKDKPITSKVKGKKKLLV